MDDLVTLCLLGIFVIVGLLLLPRLLRGFGSPNAGGSGMGNERPEYDDPDIRSRGGFGRPRTTRRYDDPNIRGRGFFGRPRSGGGSIFGTRRSGRTDDPNIRSRGGFGRDKD